MFRPLVALSALTALALVASGCGCGEPISIPCSTDADCTGGATCQAGKCTGGNTGGGSGGSGGAGGSGGGSTIVTGCNPTDPNNSSRDTDCDGLSDAEEYQVSYGGGAKTDPCNSDSDGDGIADGVEMGKTMTVGANCAGKFTADAEPGSKTDPTVADSDGDMVNDGAEDKNRDGKVDPGESNPLKIDSDCDGISDKQEIDGTLGCMTDPLKLDTDGDGLPDGLEQGLQMPGAAPGMPPLSCQYTAIHFDADMAVKTNACQADSDGDGIQDGAEDANQNGRVDMGELNPNAPADGMGPAKDACAVMNLKPINFHLAPGADIQVALVPAFTEVVQLTDASGGRGVMFYDSMHQVVGLAIDDQPSRGSGPQIESYARGVLNGRGTISAPLTQTFTTWDGFAQSVRATYDQAGNADLKAHMNSIAQAFGVMGALSGTAGATGPFKIQAQYVHRAATRGVILIAMTPQAMFSGQTLFTLDDVAGGSALAQFGDYAGVTCEVFDATVNAKVDFIWTVDDSCSMASSQTAVSRTGSLFVQRLAAAGLDWRAAAVSAGYNDNDCSNGCTRAFTNDGALMTRWFTPTDGLFWGTGGDVTEEILGSARKLISSDLLPKDLAGANNKIRTEAQVHVIALGDVHDQSQYSGAELLQFFGNFDGAGGMLSKATVHGIVCPPNSSCGDSTTPATTPEQTVINGTGGVQADIRTFNVQNPTAAQQAQQQAVIDAIMSAVIGSTGHQLQKPPISATIKVAIEANGTRGPCNTADIPRDRMNGFDFDAASRRLVFYGNCIPSASGKKVAVSYRFWVDGSPDPGGDPCNNTCTAPKACDPGSAMCVCPTNCGGACTGTTTCDMASCTCVPGIG